MLHGSVSPARTASRSPWSPSAKRRSSGIPPPDARASQRSNEAPRLAEHGREVLGQGIGGRHRVVRLLHAVQVGLLPRRASVRTPQEDPGHLAGRGGLRLDLPRHAGGRLTGPLRPPELRHEAGDGGVGGGEAPRVDLPPQAPTVAAALLPPAQEVRPIGGQRRTALGHAHALRRAGQAQVAIDRLPADADGPRDVGDVGPGGAEPVDRLVADELGGVTLPSGLRRPLLPRLCRRRGGGEHGVRGVLDGG